MVEGLGIDPRPLFRWVEGLGIDPRPLFRWVEGLGIDPRPIFRWVAGLGIDPGRIYCWGFGSRRLRRLANTSASGVTIGPGARLLGVDLEYSEVARRGHAYRNAPASRSRTYESLVLDRNGFMAERILEAGCERAILLVGAAHAHDPMGHTRRTIPALLAEVGISSMVFEPRCVRAPPGGFSDGRTEFPAVRITAPDEDSFGDLVIEAGCIWD